MKSVSNYNPFEALTPSFLHMLQAKGQRLLIAQRFAWPGVPDKKGFIVTAYTEPSQADYHISQLQPGEGKLLDLDNAAERSKLLTLIEPRSEFHFFYSTTPDATVSKKIAQAYRQKVHGYIKSRLALKNDGGYEVSLKLSVGRLMATVSSGDQHREVLFYEMIK